jgi:Arc/MetJ-type ribon-helix-helix transcriptional regulator
MTQRSTKTVTIALPLTMVEELDRVREQEHRTRSEFVRQALREYIARLQRGRRIQVVDPEPDEVEALRRGREAIAKDEFVTLDDLLHELGTHR